MHSTHFRNVLGHRSLFFSDALSWIRIYVLKSHPRSSAAAAAKSLQSCPTLPGILQARTLEWVAISFSNAWKWKVKVKSLSRVWPSATPWTADYQAPLSIGFSRQEYWSGVPLPSPFWNWCQKNTFACLSLLSPLQFLLCTASYGGKVNLGFLTGK